MTPDVPLHLLRLWNPSVGNDDAATDWQKALRREFERSAFEMTGAERDSVREYGLAPGRKPVNLGEHHADDRLGREVLTELATKARR